MKASDNSNKKPTHKDLLFLLGVFSSVLVAAYIQFKLILGISISYKSFVMPVVVGLIFGLILTYLRILRRSLDDEVELHRQARADISLLNSRLNEQLTSRTELLRDAQAQLNLAQQRASLSALSAGVVHDLNNALMLISVSWEELIEDRSLGETSSAFNHDLIDDINTGLDQFLSLTKSFQRLIRPSARRQQSSIKRLLTRLIPFLKHSFTPHQRLAFDSEGSDDLFCVSLDESHVTQLVMNLIMNARDALEHDSGEVSVRLFYESKLGDEMRWVCLEVSDTGCGMSEETQARIFDPFFTTKAEGEGTGLGLHVIAEMIRSHQGMVDVQSERQVGTTFTIRLTEVSMPEGQDTPSEAS